MRLSQTALVPEAVLPHTYRLARHAVVIAHMLVRGVVASHFNVAEDPVVSRSRLKKCEEKGDEFCCGGEVSL